MATVNLITMFASFIAIMVTMGVLHTRLEHKIEKLSQESNANFDKMLRESNAHIDDKFNRLSQKNDHHAHELNCP